MEPTTTLTRDDAQQESEQRVPWAAREWLRSTGRLLDERAFLAALGRGGAQRMAIPLGEG